MWVLISVAAIVMGGLLGNVILYPVFRSWAALPSRPAVRLATATGTVCGYLVTAWVLPTGGSLLSFVSGPALPGLFWLVPTAIALLAITVSGWKQ